MNFLAHAFLSPNVPLVRMGNMLGDMVKGKLMLDVHPEVKQGVLLHREIDFFTDRHPKILEAITYLKPVLGRYTGIAVDVLFDHYLSKNWSSFSAVSLQQYVQELFSEFEAVEQDVTPRMRRVAKLMEEHQWIFQYQTLDGLKNIYEQMSRRVENRVFFPSVIPSVEKRNQQLERLFFDFFQDLQANFSFE